MNSRGEVSLKKRDKKSHLFRQLRSGMPLGMLCL